MAEPFDTLIEVQDRDTALDQLRHRLEALPERAALVDLDLRRAELESAASEVRAQVEDLSGRQEALEERIAAAAARRHELERRMQSGEAYAARDLQAIDHETQQLATRQAHYEEEEIALLEEEEPLDETLARHQETETRLRAEAEQLQATIAEAEARDRGVAAQGGGGPGRVRGPPPGRPGRTVRAASCPIRRYRGGEADRRPLRRLPSHPALGRRRPHPPPATGRARALHPVRPDPRPVNAAGGRSGC